MKRPSLQLYPADLTGNAKLKRSSWGARGVWMWTIALMHDSDEYGVLRWPMKEIQSAVGCPMPLLRELVDKEVLKGQESGSFPGFFYRPRSGRKEGDPVELIAPCDAPIYFSSRMVVDEYVRKHRGAKTRFGADLEDGQPSPDTSPNTAPSRAPTRRQSDGPTSPSTSTLKPSPHSPPRGASPQRRKKRESTTFDEFVANCKANGEQRIPEDDPVHTFASGAGIPEPFIGLAWKRFRGRHEGKTKRYKDWRQAFRNCVEDNWYGLWFFDKTDAACRLTTAGEGFRRVLKEPIHAG